jgi:O-acetylhomoserine (thiol)-lyase
MPLDAKDMKLATLAIHGGVEPDPAYGAPQTPIYQSVSFEFPDAKTASDRFNLREFGQIYSRLTNPTVDALEARLAALDGGVGAIAAASGHAAQMLALLPLVLPGDHIVGSKRLYGGSTSQLTNTFPTHFNWQSTLVDPDEPDNFERAITERTRAIFIEALANPGGVVVDLEAIAKIAERHHIPLIVDNTLATPYLLRPLEWGANVVTYSTTKYLTGNGTALGGAFVDGGNFDWAKDDRFPALTEGCSAYHGMKLHENFGNMALFVHGKAVGLRDIGASQQPMNAFMTLCGLETLAVRMDRHCHNAQLVAEWLSQHDQVASVMYAGLPDSPYHSLAQKYTPKGPSSLFSFDIKGGMEEAARFIEALELFTFVANLGDTRSLLIHPASTTHSQLSPEHRAAANITDGTMRISIGLEDSEDILADLARGFAVI